MVGLGAIKKNTLLGPVSQKDTETAVAKWLTGARDRGGKRTERAQREHNKRKAAEADLCDEDC